MKATPQQRFPKRISLAMTPVKTTSKSGPLLVTV